MLTFSGRIDLNEMKKWVSESKAALAKETGSYSVIVDMRMLSPLSPDVQQVMVEGQQLYKQKGMTRSSVNVNDNVTALQFKRLAKKSGIYTFERYIDGSKPDYQSKAIGWARDNRDPDK